MGDVVSWSPAAPADAKNITLQQRRAVREDAATEEARVYEKSCPAGLTPAEGCNDKNGFLGKECSTLANKVTLAHLTCREGLCADVQEHIRDAYPTPRDVDALPRGPQRHTVPIYSTSQCKDLTGLLQAGEVAQLKLGETMCRVWLSVYLEGFTVSPSSESTDLDDAESHPWSPFTLVEQCRIQTKTQAKSQEQHMSVFKISVLREDSTDDSYFFGCLGANPEDQRERWMESVISAVSRVTVSLIPVHSLAVRPVPGVPNTMKRLLAGYLLLLVDNDCVATYYGELQAQENQTARIALYQDEWCEHEVMHIMITDSSVISSRKKRSCTVFGVDRFVLCSRTWNEKELWLRAVNNIKVKLMFDAPDPTREIIRVYRNAVLDRLAEIDGLHEADVGNVVEAPLLEPVRSRCSQPSAVGDVVLPDPVESTPYRSTNATTSVLFRGGFHPISTTRPPNAVVNPPI
eukprot:TRINITY_DN16801_c0_g1_i2.p1 TRINITY_DN16801_c0_g1~~TRINITY_DN16801_c0_g1_i2.p1  ORF type:complete len:461 (-),score=53.23 TRINITY_DN16801_c0_g1_i2:342-1724(-)